MVVIAPTPIIAGVAAGKFLKDIVNKIPLVSAADAKNINKVINSATRPPRYQDRGDSVHIDIGPGGSIGLKKPKW